MSAYSARTEATLLRPGVAMSHIVPVEAAFAQPQLGAKCALRFSSEYLNIAAF